MCSGPVGNNQSYWGLIRIKMGNAQMSEQQLDAFKAKLIAFLNDQIQTGLPVSADLVNGTIKTDAQDGTSIQLVKMRP